MSHHPKPSNDIADILAGTLMVSRGTALDIMRDTLATTGTQCQWRQADTISMPDTWEAECGAAWTFTDGGPKDNSMKFCPQCGHPLKQIDNDMTHKNDPYASEAETQAMMAPDTRTDAERKLDKMMDELGAWEQGAEPYPLLRHIALELLKKQLAEQPAQQQEPVAYSYTSRITGAQGFSHHPMPRFIDSESWDIKPLYTRPQARKPLHIGEEAAAFKAWFDAWWIGDGEQGETIPRQSDKHFLTYLDQYTLGFGAWMAAKHAAHGIGEKK